MSRISSTLAASTAAILTALMLAGAATAFAAEPPTSVAMKGATVKSKLSTNQDFIEGLANTMNLNDTSAVFWHVFSQLPDQVIVYPSENYYYWSFYANAKPIHGNIRLDAFDRDQGLVHFGYFEYDENGKFQDVDGWDKVFSKKDGVVLEKRGRFEYALTYRGKTVVFHLFQTGMAPPKKEKLRPDEVYIGQSYDKSGVRFYLIFNKTVNHFSYVLNEDVPPPETYATINPHLIVGRRTGFAYYVDKVNNRKILVAAFAPNIQRNNYYDGPFDQEPDNYIDQTHLKKYLELAYPQVKGRINKFGHFTDQKGVRAGIFAYYAYFDEEELHFVDVCLKKHQNKAQFYACISPDPQQRNGVPPAGSNPNTRPRR